MTYKWTRYWIPKGAQLDTRNGFLKDPKRRTGLYQYGIEQQHFELDEIEDGCAVLLGEPGIGKTTEVESFTKRARSKTPSNHQVLHVELGMITGYAALRGELLEAPEIQDWKQGEADLTLVLDALDECGMDRIGHYLRKKLFTDPYPFDRLTLRITCRSSDWPESLNESLCSFWGLQDLPIYHLAPLRQQDVIEAAEANREDGNAFLKAVQEAGAGPFAASPLTLEALLSRYKRHKEILTSRTELFEEYCRRLSTEENKDRKAEDEIGILEPVQRVDLLSRIAALMIFGQRIQLSLDQITSNAADEIADHAAVLFVNEVRLENSADSTDFPDPTFREIRDAVRHSGLLRGYDEGRTFRWRHQSYAEYLAARFIDKYEFSLPQIRSVLENEYDQAVAPSYQNVAGWLATLDKDAMEYLLDKDPSLVYAGDPLQYEDERRKELIELILQSIDQGRIYTRGNDKLNDLTRTAHPELEGQLRRWIVDVAKSDDAREFAIQIARKQELDRLVPDAIDVALDTHARADVRIFAMRLVDELGSIADRKKLRSLAVDPGQEDVDRRVAYQAREIQLPDLLSFSDLLDQIRADAQWSELEKVEGNWYQTLDQWSIHIVLRMDDDMLVEALQWAFREHKGTLYTRLRRTIVRQSLKHLDLHEIKSLFASTITSYAHEDEHPGHRLLRSQFLDHEWEDDTEAHRDVTRMIVNRLAGLTSEEARPQQAIRRLQVGKRFWQTEDVKWLLNDLQEAEEEDVRRLYAKIIRSFFYRDGISDLKGFELIYEVCQSSDVLKNEVESWINPIELSSEKARELREQEKKFASWGPDPMDPPLRKRLSDALTRCEDDPKKGWAELCHLLTLTSIENDHDKHDVRHSVTEMPAWKELSPDQRRQVALAGVNYLRRAQLTRTDWLSGRNLAENFVSGFIALWLLANHDDPSLSAVEAKVWKTWCPAVFAWAPSTSERRQDAQHKLTRTAYRHAPQECRSVLSKVLSHFGYDKRALTFLLDPISENDDVQSLLLDVLKNESTPRGNRLALALYLLQIEIKEARQPARKLAQVVEEEEKEKKEKDEVDQWPLNWFISVLESDPAFGWSLIQERFLSDDEYAKRMIHRMARRRVDVTGIPSREFGMALLRVHDLFPPRNDLPTKFEVHSSTSREQIQYWRRDLVGGLVHLGTNEAVEALQSIAAHYPDARNWGLTIHRAKKTLRDNSTPATLPRTLLTLARDASQRLVRTDADLQRVVIEALSDLQGRLNAQEQPASQDLWIPVEYGPRRGIVRNWLQTYSSLEGLQEEVKEIKGTLYLPRKEESLSNYIARELRRDLQGRGVTITRESEVRIQNRTDLLVKVPSTIGGKSGPLRVIIEVKGPWNKDLLSSIESQLADRYLDPEDTEYGTSRGIYLIVWFDLERWSDQDSRRRKAARHESAEELQKKVEGKIAEIREENDEDRIKPFILRA